MMYQFFLFVDQNAILVHSVSAMMSYFLAHFSTYKTQTNSFKEFKRKKNSDRKACLTLRCIEEIL